MTNTNTPSHTFETGSTYVHGWIGDADMKTEWVVVRRTAKTVRIKSHGEEVTCRVKVDYRGEETVKPYGSYSMAPILRASKVVSDQEIEARINSYLEFEEDREF